MIAVSTFGVEQKDFKDIKRIKTFGRYLLKPKNGFEDYLLEPVEVFYYFWNYSSTKNKYKFFFLIIPSIKNSKNNFYSLEYEKNDNKYCNLNSKYFYLNSCLDYFLFLLPQYKRRFNKNDLNYTFDYPWTIRPKEKLRKYKLNKLI